MIAANGAAEPIGRADAPRAQLPPAALLVLFFASGASGLVYEIVWIRILSLTLSVTVDAVTTVLCAYMAGLALGATVGGRLADRLAQPLRAYGLVEIGVALTGLATPAILFRLGPGYVWLHHQLGGTGLVFVLARFLLAFVVLLLPCSLMGATLPLLSRIAVADHGRVARGAGGLYAINTLGAVVGCLAAGFVLIPAGGLTMTNAIAVGLSALVGITAVVLGRRRGLAPHVDQATASPWTARGRIVCAAFALSGFTAIGYEVLWTRGLEPFTHNSTYAYSAMLAIFLLGLGVGSAVTSLFADRLRHPVFAFGVVELAIGASVTAALLVYARFGTLVPAIAEGLGGLTSWARVVALIFSAAGVVLLGTTLLFGATFPLVARAVADSWARLGGRIGTAYALNTVGGIAGALVTGFVLLPGLGMRGAFVTLVLMNLGVGAALALVGAPERIGRTAAVGAALALAVATLMVVPAGLFEQRFVERFGRLLFYREQVTDTVMVTEDARGERMIRYADGRGTAGTITVPEDRMYAHAAMLLHPDPRRVLSICFGVGNSLASVLTYPVEHVDAVELSPGVIRAAPFFEKTNRNPLADPRVHLTIQDGRNFLLANEERYDIIRLDPPELHTAGIVNLYTREFFELARADLAPGGIFSIWVNVVMTPEDDLRTLARTLADVFPNITVWRGPYQYSWVFNASVEPHPPDLKVMSDHWAQPAVASDLASIGVPDVFAFLRFFVLGGGEVLEFAGPGPLVTDDHTRLDFSVPRSFDAFFGFANANTDSWLVDLMKPEHHQVGARAFLTKVARMMRFQHSVVPHLVHVEEAGFDRETVRARLADLANHGGGAEQPAGNSPRQPSSDKSASAATR